jgi:excisionase family DNA binding protein
MWSDATPTSTSRKQRQHPVNEGAENQTGKGNTPDVAAALWRITEAASFLNISPGTLFHWVSQKRIPCIRFGPRCLRFDQAQTKEWAARHGQPESLHAKRDI